MAFFTFNLTLPNGLNIQLARSKTIQEKTALENALALENYQGRSPFFIALHLGAQGEKVIKITIAPSLRYSDLESMLLKNAA